MSSSEATDDPSCSSITNSDVQDLPDPETDSSQFATVTESKEFPCDVCGKVFEKKKYLISHGLFHSGVKSHGCTTCGVLFMRKSELNRHIKSHTGVKSHSCELCGKKFTRSSQLKNHINIHNGVKNYECKCCGKKFTQKNNLVKHFRIHTGERNYVCLECGKKYHLKESLTYHMRTHSGERKHACEKCGKAFTNLRGLRYHKENYVCLRRHLGIEIIKDKYPHELDFNELEEYHEVQKGSCNSGDEDLQNLNSPSENLVVPETNNLYKDSYEETLDKGSNINNTLSAMKADSEVCSSSREVFYNEKKETKTAVKSENLAPLKTENSDEDCDLHIEFVKVEDFTNSENSCDNV